jgi:hypothetical protein
MRDSHHYPDINSFPLFSDSIAAPKGTMGSNNWVKLASVRSACSFGFLFATMAID